MIRNCFFALAVGVILLSGTVYGGGTLSFSTTQPAVSGPSQSDLVDDAAVPGGTTPGGGTYNSQSFSDNAGPPGQTFTTPAGSQLLLNAISLKGANTGGGNSGGNVFAAGTTWSVRISSVSGTNLTPIRTVDNIATVIGALGTEWFTFAFTAPDVVTLSPSTQYAFELYSSTGYMGFDADTTNSYAGGNAFNSAGALRSFTDNTLGNVANHGYDRTFIVSLAPVPEPGTLVLLAIGGLGAFLGRKRLSK